MVKKPELPRNNDEIDLLELFLKAVVMIQNNFWLIVIFFVVGTGLGFTYFMATKKVYQSKMIISSNILTTSYARVLFDNVNGHVADGDYDVLAADLHIEKESAKQIASLRIENVSKADGNELKESERYLITAEVYDQSVLPSLEKGIIQYFENNEFVRIRVEQQRSALTQMLATIDKELAELQKFKEDIYSGNFFSTAKGNVMFDPTSVNTKVLELTQKRIETQNALQLINSVQLIEGFTAFKHHVKPSFMVSMVAGSFLGLFLAGALVVLKAIRRLLRLAKANDTKHAA